MMDETSFALHAACAPLEFLLGTWRGRGTGHYPTIDEFAYEEEVVFSHNGRPFLSYVQRTRSAENGAQMHSETGFWRPQRDGAIEVVLAHPFGATEILEGTLRGTRIDLASTAIASTSTAKAIAGTSRSFEVTDGLLRYEMQMATAGHELQGHLEAELRFVRP